LRSSEIAMLVVALSLSGCFAPLDLTHRQCPCTAGWSCDEGRNVCVQSAVDAHFSSDAGLDAGLDAPPVDAFGLDAFALDMGMRDSGGGPHDAGNDAAVLVDVGARRDAGSSACPPTAVICEGFEAATAPSNPPWGTALMTRATTHVHAGAAAGLARFSGPGDVQRYIGIPLVDAVGTEIWARAWYYIDSTATIQVAPMVIQETVPPYHNVGITGATFGFGIYSGVSNAYMGSLPYNTQEWFCLSLHTISAASGLLTASSSSTMSITETTDTRLASAVEMQFGYAYIDPAQTNAIDLYIDEIVVTTDGTALPCP